MNHYHATSYSALLDLPRLATATSWSILSTHRHACNLMAEDGTFIALVNDVHGNGPFHILLPHTHFDTLTLATPIKWRAEQIKLAHLTIDLREARPWHPQLPRLTNPASLASLAAYQPLATMRSALYSGSMPLVERAQGAIAQLRDGFTQKNTGQFRPGQFRPGKFQQGVEGLVGLGPGLTPAGDDFLLGLLVAFTLLRTVQPSIYPYSKQIADRAATASTRLSAIWLSYAGQGYFGEEWHRLIDLLNCGAAGAIGQAIHTILNTGATSGADALCGFFVGMEMLGLSR